MKRRIMVSVVVVVMLVGSAYLAAAAGGPGCGGKGGGPGMHGDRMAEVLGLSDTQKEQVSAILKAEQEKTEPLRQQLFENRKLIMESSFSGKFDEAAVRAIAAKQAPIITELMVSHARAKSEIHALLTPEQRTLAQKLGPMMGPRHGHMQRFGDDE
jgi:periplasmic protein CpxP/Spy